MSKLIAAVSVTVDGIFDGSQEWFPPYHSEARNRYMGATIFEADALLVGRKTYDLLSSTWPQQRHPVADKMNSLPKYVVTSKPLEQEWNQVAIGGNIGDEVRRLKETAGGTILVLGSLRLCQALAAHDLVDEYRLLVHPVVMGSGRPFFAERERLMKLTALETTPLDLGVILLRYAINN